MRHVSVFGFARIPLLVMLGDQLDDKFPTDVYEHHRDGLRWKWADDGQPVSFRFDRVSGDASADVVAIACTVPLDGLPEETPLAGSTSCGQTRRARHRPHPAGSGTINSIPIWPSRRPTNAASAPNIARCRDAG